MLVRSQTARACCRVSRVLLECGARRMGHSERRDASCVRQARSPTLTASRCARNALLARLTLLLRFLTCCVQWASGYGSRECNKCPAGKAQSLPRSVDCQNCSLGYFASTDGRAECLPCSPGTFAAQNGSKDCLECKRGSFQGFSGQSGCVSCPVGRFASVDRRPEVHLPRIRPRTHHSGSAPRVSRAPSPT